MSQSSDMSASSTATITPADRHEVLYFAFGSNLSTGQMLQRCPSSVPVGLGYLPGWKWIINERGYANIVQVDTTGSPVKGQGCDIPMDGTGESSADKGKGKQTEDSDSDVEVQKFTTGVYGLVYLLPPQDETSLDGYEGVPWAYQKEKLEVEMVPSGSMLQQQQGSDQPVRIQVNMALVYVDKNNVTEGDPQEEYVVRMNVGIEEAIGEWGMPEWYVEEVLRRFIPGEDGDEEMEE
jgi:hypothetical protein